MLIDSHAHLLDERLKDHIAEIVGEYPANDVEISVEIGADMQSSRGAVALANSYDNIYAVVGLHPESAESATDKDIEEIAILAKNKKVVAIGEIGLDYHYDYDKTIQKSVCFYIFKFLKKYIQNKKQSKQVFAVPHCKPKAKDSQKYLKTLWKARCTRNHCSLVWWPVRQMCTKVGQEMSFSPYLP